MVNWEPEFKRFKDSPFTLGWLAGLMFCGDLTVLLIVIQMFFTNDIDYSLVDKIVIPGMGLVLFYLTSGFFKKAWPIYIEEQNNLKAKQKEDVDQK